MDESRAFADRRHDRDVQSVGPFSAYPTMVNGWTVPYLEAMYCDDGSVNLILDGRMSIDVPADRAGQVIGFVADAIAIALGYPCHPSGEELPEKRPPWHRMHGITFVEEM